MKLTIVGAGAIGGVCGAYLIKAGHDVTFVDLVEEHVRTINERGLTIGLLRYTSGEPGEVERGKAGIRNAIIGYIGAALSPVIVTIIAGWVA